eukprot:Skav219931  [mRNA]  locus=scaffold4801:61112:68925:- [translate_table: standard]
MIRPLANCIRIACGDFESELSKLKLQKSSTAARLVSRRSSIMNRAIWESKHPRSVQLTERTLERDDFGAQLQGMRTLIKNLKDLQSLRVCLVHRYAADRRGCKESSKVNNALPEFRRMSCMWSKSTRMRSLRSVTLWNQSIWFAVRLLDSSGFFASHFQHSVHWLSWHSVISPSHFQHFSAQGTGPASALRRAELQQQNQRLSTLSAQLRRETDRSLAELQRKADSKTAGVGSHGTVGYLCDWISCEVDLTEKQRMEIMRLQKELKESTTEVKNLNRSLAGGS